jgi:NAD(P)-dependent dehydrogenase (short-subunit alcohol dehydrogenase family)
VRAVVTGAGPGSIGEATADALAAQGVDVIVTTRTKPVDRLEWRPLDLADRESVEAFVAWFASQYDELELLVNSAGVHLDLGSRWREPVLVDGHEIHWRVNYLGTVHLTHRLLPALLQATDHTGDARVVHLTSRLHARGDADSLLGRPSPRRRHAMSLCVSSSCGRPPSGSRKADSRLRDRS